MRVVYFVKDGCDACKKAREKVEFFLGRWGASDRLDRQTHSISTVDGLVEAAMREVHDIPTVILEDDGAEVGRWARRPPTSVELRAALGTTVPAQDPDGPLPADASL
jgi:glutaredoxin